ncbi:hypothetical protein BRC90_05370 [Halobacteriales archaeon QS_4_69_34]|nr:MAG: hypothetical protein BRC90_05370 [Halobacteriales archaeon QS_4_69_34]
MVRLPLGDGSPDVSLPDCDIGRRAMGGEPVDPCVVAKRAMADPTDRDSHRAGRLDSGDEVVVTDVTRAMPAEALLDAPFAELRSAGIEHERIRSSWAGLYRPLTDAERGDSLSDYAALALNHDPEGSSRSGASMAVPPRSIRWSPTRTKPGRIRPKHSLPVRPAGPPARARSSSRGRPDFPSREGATRKRSPCRHHTRNAAEQ